MNVSSRYYAVVAWAGIALIGLAALITALQREWTAVLILVVFGLLSSAFVALRIRLPAFFDLIFVLASMVNAAGYVWDLFSTVWFYDELAHAFTTFALSLALGFLLYREVLNHSGRHAVLFMVIVSSLGVSAGALWEIFEYAAGIPIDLGDTIWDLVYDTIGAVAAGLIAMFRMRSSLRAHRGANGQSSSPLRGAPEES